MLSFKKPAYLTALCTALVLGLTLSACGNKSEEATDAATTDAGKAEQLRGAVKDITAKATSTASDVASKTVAKASEVASQTGETLQKAGSSVSEAANSAVDHVQDRIKAPSVSEEETH